MLWSAFDDLTARDAVKFVIADRDDYDWAKEVLKNRLRHLLPLSGAGQITSNPELLFSPAFGALTPDVLVSWILEDRLPVRLNLQLHKYVWDPDKTGV